MIVLLQRVSSACVRVKAQTVATIDSGLLVYVAIQPEDDNNTVARMAERIVGYRIFADQHNKMNLSVGEVNGAILLVPQFTLAADTRKGMRPSFSSTAPPSDAQSLFNELAKQVQQRYDKVVCGHFQADMQVDSINDGPATFILSV